jgi:hypothetical protein
MALTNEERKEIQEIIKLTVNGKIDRLTNLVETHIVTVAPVVEAVMWINSTRKFLLYFSSIAIAIASFVTLYKLF